jgi:hypothetical protein
LKKTTLKIKFLLKLQIIEKTIVFPFFPIFTKTIKLKQKHVSGQQVVIKMVKLMASWKNYGLKGCIGIKK